MEAPISLTLATMVRFLRRLPNLCFLAAGVLAAPAYAQQPGPVADSNLEQRTGEWLKLANSLESRITRMLPCDARIPSAIEEVSKASKGRMDARNEFWQAQADRSRAQIAALRELQTVLQTEASDATSDTIDAEQERSGVTAMSADLNASSSRKPVLAPAVNELNALARQSEELGKISADRGSNAAALGQQLLEVIAAAEARQSAIESEQQAIAVEGSVWASYYSARLARAQTECAITKQAPPAASTEEKPAARPKPAAKRPASRRRIRR
jgi:hypothetical protein